MNLLPPLRHPHSALMKLRFAAIRFLAKWMATIHNIHEIEIKAIDWQRLFRYLNILANLSDILVTVVAQKNNYMPYTKLYLLHFQLSPVARLLAL